ncbi:hypothetical protein [Burkholderia pseudomallei]|uniref:hypothetical protein n=1 Tax=Burkholderia pseudomallei TaxID=28450 RepID=UPI000F063FE7|nr:hypothetical protein [Burkholderia pseudomallei]
MHRVTHARRHAPGTRSGIAQPHSIGAFVFTESKQIASIFNSSKQKGFAETRPSFIYTRIYLHIFCIFNTIPGAAGGRFDRGIRFASRERFPAASSGLSLSGGHCVRHESHRRKSRRVSRTRLIRRLKIRE